MSQTSAPPATPIPYKSYSNILWNEEQNDSFFSPSSDVAHKRNCSTSYELLPEYHDRGFQYLPHSSTYENESESTIFLGKLISCYWLFDIDFSEKFKKFSYDLKKNEQMDNIKLKNFNKKSKK